MFHNFMYLTGCCRAALVEVNYSPLSDLIETEEGRERKPRRKKAKRAKEAYSHLFTAVK